MKSSKALSLVSLATKAGKTASGEFCTEKEVKTGMAELVIVAEDASANTKKKFKNMCDFYEVPIYFYGDKDTLGHAMGKEFRATLAVTDAGFAKGIKKHLETEGYNDCIEEVVSMTKVRVHELAKELNKTNKEVLDVLREKI